MLRAVAKHVGSVYRQVFRLWHLAASWHRQVGLVLAACYAADVTTEKIGSKDPLASMRSHDRTLLGCKDDRTTNAMLPTQMKGHCQLAPVSCYPFQL